MHPTPADPPRRHHGDGFPSVGTQSSKALGDILLRLLHVEARVLPSLHAPLVRCSSSADQGRTSHGRVDVLIAAAAGLFHALDWSRPVPPDTYRVRLRPPSRAAPGEALRWLVSRTSSFRRIPTRRLPPGNGSGGPGPSVPRRVAWLRDPEGAARVPWARTSVMCARIRGRDVPAFYGATSERRALDLRSRPSGA